MPGGLDRLGGAFFVFGVVGPRGTELTVTDECMYPAWGLPLCFDGSTGRTAWPADWPEPEPEASSITIEGTLANLDGGPCKARRAGMYERLLGLGVLGTNGGHQLMPVCDPSYVSPNK